MKIPMLSVFHASQKYYLDKKKKTDAVEVLRKTDTISLAVRSALDRQP